VNEEGKDTRDGWGSFFFEKLKGKYFMKRRKIQKKIRRKIYRFHVNNNTS